MNFISISSLLLLSLILWVRVLDARDQQSFKINKLNLIWDKAQHSLGANKLKDLKNDLLKHELEELNVKKLKAHSQDKDGLVEASVRKKLQSIMRKYSIDRYYHDIHPIVDPVETFEKKPVPNFRDSKLDKLWKKAEKAGFSQEQLMMLHEEFEHQQDKVDSHYETASNMDEELDEHFQKLDKSENSIEGYEPEHDRKKKFNSKQKETAADKKARLEANVQQALKKEHRDIKKGYGEISNKIKTGSLDSSGPFKESRVNELWTMASQSNFTQEELQSLKEELEHYEIRIEKLKHFQNQLDRHKIGNKDYGMNHEGNEESKHIERKVEELTRNVEKTDKSIVGRIIKDEL